MSPQPYSAVIREGGHLHTVITSVAIEGIMKGIKAIDETIRVAIELRLLM